MYQNFKLKLSLTMFLYISLLACRQNNQDPPPEARTMSLTPYCSILLPTGWVLGKEADCGYVESPWDWNKPDGDKYRFSFFRIRSKSPKPTEPALFLHFGGPGSNGKKEFEYLAKVRDLLGQNRDLIAIGQKGTTFSISFPECEWSKDDNSLPTDLTSYIEVFKKKSQECRKNLENSGFDIRRFLTKDLVKDIEALRLELAKDPERGSSYSQIIFTGVSYGSFVAFEYARQYKDSLKKIVFDSIYPPNTDRENAFFLAYYTPIQYLRKLDEQCPTYPTCRDYFKNPLTNEPIQFLKMYLDYLERNKNVQSNILSPALLKVLSTRSMFMKQESRLEFLKSIWLSFKNQYFPSVPPISPNPPNTPNQVSTPDSSKLSLALISNLFPNYTKTSSTFSDDESLSPGILYALGFSEINNIELDKLSEILNKNLTPEFANLKSFISIIGQLVDSRGFAYKDLFKESSKYYGNKFKISISSLLVNSTFDPATTFSEALKSEEYFSSNSVYKFLESSCGDHGVVTFPLPLNACQIDIFNKIYKDSSFPNNVDISCLSPTSLVELEIPLLLAKLATN